MSQPENAQEVQDRAIDGIPFTYLLGLHTVMMRGQISYDQYCEYQKIVMPILQSLTTKTQSGE